MRFERCHYDVTAQVRFTHEDAELLVRLAKTHYDDVCRAAGLMIHEGVKVNGFIAQLVAFPTAAMYTVVTWKFREFDLAAKILEDRSVAHGMKRLTGKELRTCDTLNADILRVMKHITATHKKLEDA